MRNKIIKKARLKLIFKQKKIKIKIDVNFI